MKAIKVLVIVGTVLVLAVVAGLAYVNRYVQSPEFKQMALEAARQATGSDVNIEELRVSLSQGAELRGITLANPPGFPGELLTAKSFTLNYRLWPLLRRRIEVTTLKLQSPVVVLRKNEQGEWNYQNVGGKEEGEGSKIKSKSEIESKKEGGGLKVAVSWLGVDDAEVEMWSDSSNEVLRVSGVKYSTALDVAGAEVSGSGKMNIREVRVIGAVVACGLASPVTLTGREVKLPALTGNVADGELTGDAVFDAADQFKYAVNVRVKDARINPPLEIGSTRRGVLGDGKLQFNAALTGAGGLETMVGTGAVEVIAGTLVQMPLQELIATVLMVPELREIEFEEFRMEFTVTNNTVQTPVISVKAPGIQIAGKGSVALADYTLNHDFTLALAPNILAHVPSEVREVFAERADGWLTIDFRVWGPYDKPKTDLTKRVVKGAAKEFLKKILGSDTK